MSKHHPAVLKAAHQLTSRRQPPWYADEEECEAYDKQVESIAEGIATRDDLDLDELERANIERNMNR